jgi:fermentation-respiration switch protein FrsA (DUF1100 family)
MSSNEGSHQSAKDVPKPFTWRRRLARAAFIYGVIPYLVVTMVFVAFQRRFIYQPTRTERLLARDVSARPDAVVNDVTLHAANGIELHGWRFHATAANSDEDPVLVIYFPGNAGCRRDRLDDCRELVRYGCDVVLFDYRGYGDSGGSPSETMLAADARREWLFVKAELNIRPGRIVLFGESLGGAVATRLAAELSLAGTPPAALVLNSTFASLAETAAWHYPAFPFQYCLIDRFPSVERIPHVTAPVILFHGTADTIVPLTQGRRLFDAAPAVSANGFEKRFVTIRDGEHNAITVSEMKSQLGDLLQKIRAEKLKPAASDSLE